MLPARTSSCGTGYPQLSPDIQKSNQSVFIITCVFSYDCRSLGYSFMLLMLQPCFQDFTTNDVLEFRPDCFGSHTEPLLTVFLHRSVYCHRHQFTAFRCAKQIHHNLFCRLRLLHETPLDASNAYRIRYPSSVPRLSIVCQKGNHPLCTSIYCVLWISLYYILCFHASIIGSQIGMLSDQNDLTSSLKSYKIWLC